MVQIMFGKLISAEADFAQKTNSISVFVTSGFFVLFQIKRKLSTIYLIGKF